MKKQHYLIGTRIYDDEQKKCIEGLYGLEQYNTNVCLAFENIATIKRDVRVFSFTDRKDAEKFITCISRKHSKEFSRRAKRCGVDRKQFGFYLLKLNSIKFSKHKVVGLLHPSSSIKENFPSCNMLIFKHASYRD